MIMPDFIDRNIGQWRNLLGISDFWHIYVKMTDKPNGSAEYSGICKTDKDYLNANLEFTTDLEDTKYSREVVCHELIHISMADIDAVINEMIKALPKQLRKSLGKRYRSTVEQYVQRTSRALINGIEELELSNGDLHSDTTGADCASSSDESE